MKRIAVLGMPNTGKSTFFNRLTGATATIGNWPGVTVDLMLAKLSLGQTAIEAIDLPGIYDLHGFSEDEAVVRRFLETTPVHLLVVILNAGQLDRQLSLALQIQRLGLPMLILLNAIDEAQQLGIEIDTAGLAKVFHCPVLPISAKYGRGEYGQYWSLALTAIEKAVMQPVDAVTLVDLETKLLDSSALVDQAEVLLRETVTLPGDRPPSITTKIDRVLLHPVWGLPLFFLAMFLMFQAVYALGVPLQEGLGTALDWFKTVALTPLVSGLPQIWQSFFIDGLYDGVGTVLAFVPVILLFFVCMAIVEDSGYLSRSAFLMDAFMERLGLDGRSFVMSLMGFGCNVPAIMGTRTMRSPGLRMLSMLIIPFSLCSARLNVFIFMTTALFPKAMAPIVLFSLYLMSFGAAIATAMIFKGKYPNREPFVLELPPYRFPTVRQMILRSWCEVKHFLTWSYRFIIFGVVAIWFLNHFPTDVPPASAGTLAGQIGAAMEPIFGILGIKAELAVSLFFGFIAKEILIGGLAVIYGQADDAALMSEMASKIDWVQAYSFMLFTLLYVPCLSTVAVIKTESKSIKFAALSVFWSIALAWIASFVFYQGARSLGF